MHLKHISILILLILLISCDSDKTRIELTTPGFGVVETSIDATSKTVDLPVLINTQDEIKGVQFTLKWDTKIAEVGQPKVNELNPGFTVSAGKAVNGQMKVLMYSLAGEVLNTSESQILTIPITIINSEADNFSLIFDNAVFAGPNAKSYEIPVTHAQLKLTR